jgi:lysine 2,3-aminomutase
MIKKRHSQNDTEPPSTLRTKLSPHLKRLVKRSSAISKEFVPSKKENGLNRLVFADPLQEDRFIKTKGLVHKYPGRVLVELTMKCAAYCRFCTRRRKVSDIKKGKLTENDVNSIVNYLNAHQDVTEVVISGGDPLTVPKQLIYFIHKIRFIKHLKIIRIHTRVPVSFPQSIPTFLYKALKTIRQTLYVSLHFEHPDELTEPTLLVIKKLRQTGAILLSQSVFLKGINDNYETLFSLFTRLAQLGIRPYYLYRCDPVVGAQHFIVPFKKEVAIMTKLRKNLSGIAYPTYVIDAPNGSGKIPVPLDFWQFEKGRFKDFKGKTISINTLHIDHTL